MMEKLENVKPCPFCGGHEIYLEDYEHHPGAIRYRVLCAECMAQVDTGTWQHGWRAIEAWNTRVDTEGRED